MKKMVPAKTVEVCDLCQRDANLPLTECVVCGKEHCYMCRAVVCGCGIDPEVCRECGRDEKVIDIVSGYSDSLFSIVRDRRAALAAYGVEKAEH